MLHSSKKRRLELVFILFQGGKDSDIFRWLTTMVMMSSKKKKKSKDSVGPERPCSEKVTDKGRADSFIRFENIPHIRPYIIRLQICFPFP